MLRQATIVGSLLLHVLLFGYALRVASRPQRRATSVAVVGDEKKKKAAPPPAKPKPRPIVAAARPRPAPLPLPSTTPSPEPKAAPAPVESGLTFDNSDAPGIVVGGGKAAPPKNAASTAGDKRERPAPRREKALSPKDNPALDDCTEAPSKPTPLTRPSDIEYTQEARQNGVEGRLVLRITVGADGAVADVQVQSSVEAALDAAAVAAVKTWTFKPAMRCGKTMGGGLFTLARRFELGD